MKTAQRQRLQSELRRVHLSRQRLYDDLKRVRFGETVVLRLHGMEMEVEPYVETMMETDHYEWFVFTYGGRIHVGQQTVHGTVLQRWPQVGRAIRPKKVLGHVTHDPACGLPPENERRRLYSKEHALR